MMLGASVSHDLRLAARSLRHRRGDLLPQAVRALGREPDRFEGARDGPDQLCVGGGARPVGQGEVVLEADPRVAPKQRGGGHAGGLPPAEGADAPRFKARHVGGEIRQDVAGRGRAQQRKAPQNIENRERRERNEPPLAHRPQARRLVGGIEDDLRPNAHLLEAAQELAEARLVRFLGGKFAKRERHRLGIGLKHYRPLFVGGIAAERLAGDLHDKPIADCLADPRDRRAIGVGVEDMPALRVTHVQVDHRGASFEAFCGSAGELVGGQRQRGVVGLRPSPAVWRDRHDDSPSPLNPSHRFPPFRPLPLPHRMAETRRIHESPSESPMTHILHRAAKAVMPVAVSGSGVEIVDAEGKRYLDASGGAAVSCLGHGHPDVLAAMRKQLDQLAYAHTAFFTTEAAERLADRLIEDAPAGLDRVYLVSGGSEAIEAALKMARQYFVEIGEPERRHIVARRQSYHGNTLGALAASGNAWRRAQFGPLLIKTHHIDPCYAYRLQREGESDADYAARAAQALEDKRIEIGPERVIAFVAETVVGATAGAVPPVGDYFKRIRSICDRYGVLLILDEVMCGMGRTGTLHACEQESVAPDLMAVAKGLGGGYQPIGAVLMARRIFEAFANGSGAFQHGHTYMGHPMAAAAALAVQDVIRRDNLLANVASNGALLQRRLADRFAGNPFVGDIRGRGLFRAIELVEDRVSKRPFDPTRKVYVRVKREAMARGLMVYPMGGGADGVQGDHVLLAPPFIVNAAQIETIVERLGEAIDAALGRR